MLPRVRNGLPDDLLMPQVYTIKKTNRQADFPVAGVEFGRGVNEFHGGKWLNGLNELNKLNELAELQVLAH